MEYPNGVVHSSSFFFYSLTIFQLVKQETLNNTSTLSHNTTRSKLAELEARYEATEHENAQLRRDKMLLVDHVADLQKQVT